MSAPAHRCGLVALVGAPNVGKSTLLNALLKERVSVAGPKPQTTRLVVRGILTRPAWQAVFLDTPGLLKPANLLESGMRQSSLEALRDADLVLYLASSDVAESAGLWRQLPLSGSRTFAVLNKADAGDPVWGLAFREGLREGLKPRAFLSVSARNGTGLAELESELEAGLPEGPALYPEDELTDLSLRQCAAEIVREKALLYVRQEVPHSVAVEVEDYREDGKGLHSVKAVLYVERESQKGILIGPGGSGLKKIGTAARKDLERLAGGKVFLSLWVKVAKGWKKDANFLRRIGYPVGRAVK